MTDASNVCEWCSVCQFPLGSRSVVVQWMTMEPVYVRTPIVQRNLRSNKNGLPSTDPERRKTVELFASSSGAYPYLRAKRSAFRTSKRSSKQRKGAVFRNTFCTMSQVNRACSGRICAIASALIPSATETAFAYLSSRCFNNFLSFVNSKTSSAAPTTAHGMPIHKSVPSPSPAIYKIMSSAAARKATTVKKMTKPRNSLQELSFFSACRAFAAAAS